MRLAEQWSEIVAALPRGWETASVALELDDPADLARTGLVLGPAAPVRAHSTFRLDVARDGRANLPSAELLGRVFARLDRDGIRGRLELVGPQEEGAEASDVAAAAGVAGRWDALVESLPEDWSHVLAQVDLDSSDFIDRASLLMVPTNPSLVRGTRSLRLRCARVAGYGASPGMVRRCFERLDRERITGHPSIVHAVSDARPVATQGPVWRVGGRSV